VQLIAELALLSCRFTQCHQCLALRQAQL